MASKEQLLNWFIYAALLAVATLAMLSYAHPPTTGDIRISEPHRKGTTNSTCFRMKRDVAVPYEGCMPATTRVWTCIGWCSSYEVTGAIPPFSASECSCCASTAHKVKPRRLYYNCSGYDDLVVKRMYLPVIQDCDCRRCDYQY